MDDTHASHIADFTAISYHMNWTDPSDPFYLANPTENNARKTYYAVSGIPNMRIDGVLNPTSISSWASNIAARKAVDSRFTIALAITYNPGTRTGTLNATVTNVSAVADSGNFRMAITESDIHYTAPNGILVHNFTMRDMVPDATGTMVRLGPGASTVVTRNFTLNASWVEANCQIVCFLQTDVLARQKEILQGARAFFPVDQPYVLLGGLTATPEPGGDGDGFVDRGETGDLVVTLNNLNIGVATGVTGTLTSADPAVTMIDGSASFGTIPAYGSATNGADPFVFSMAPTGPSGYRPQFTLTITGNGGSYTKVLTFRVPIGSPSDFTGPAGVYYAYEGSDAAYTERPAYSWVEIDSAATGLGRTIAHYDDSIDWLRIGFPFRFYGTVYDTITVSSNGWIAMGKQFPAAGSPAGSPIPDPDGPYGVVAGVWTDLNPVASGTGNRIWRYYDAANHRLIIEYDNVKHADTADRETFEIILLDPAYYPTATGDGEILVQYKDVSDPGSAVAGIENPAETLGIEFSYYGSANPAATGVVDNSVVKYTPDAPVQTGVPGIPASAGPAFLLPASPNPFTGSTDIAFVLETRGAAKLDLYGVDGRHVATLVDGVREAGVTQVAWDGCDASGGRVAAGLYFARLAAGGVVRQQKVMLLE